MTSFRGVIGTNGVVNNEAATENLDIGTNEEIEDFLREPDLDTIKAVLGPDPEEPPLWMRQGLVARPAMMRRGFWKAVAQGGKCPRTAFLTSAKHCSQDWKDTPRVLFRESQLLKGWSQ